MKITILNGNHSSGSKKFDTYLNKLVQALAREGHEIEKLDLKNMKINHCLGCWDCWVKTPGKCVIKDDTYNICRASINADFLIFASPVMVGFISSLLKRTMDRLIPLIHPYQSVRHGESHHIERYAKYPDIGLLLEKSKETADEDIEIINQGFERFRRNFFAQLRLTAVTDSPVKEVSDAINNI